MKYISSIFCKSALAVTCLLLIATGCDPKQELLFDKQANERALDLIEQCEKTLLANPNGWQMTYEVPNKDVGGKYTLQMQFMENKSVRMWADYLSKPTTSSYSFSLYDGPVLTFDTPGAITELADPAIQPYGSSKMGNGYYGENDFVIMNVSPEKILLRGLKYGKRLELTPLKEPANLTDKGLTDAYYQLAYQLTKYGSAVQLMSEANKLNKIAFEVPTLGYYIPTATDLPIFKLLLKPLTEGGKVAEYNITPTSNGFKLEPALVVGDKSYTEFIFKDADKRFVAKDNDKVWINLQAVSSMTAALTLDGGKYHIPRSAFYAVDMSDDAKKYFSKEECEKVFPGFTEMQFYNQPTYKSFAFLHKKEGNNIWQNIYLKEIQVVDDEAGIYRLVFDGVDDGEIKAALNADAINPVLVLAAYFTSAGGADRTVQIKEVADNKIRITPTTLGENFWIDFKFFTW